VLKARTRGICERALLSSFPVSTTDKAYYDGFPSTPPSSEIVRVDSDLPSEEDPLPGPCIWAF